MNKIRYLIGALALAVLGAGPALAATEATSSAFTLYTISGTSRSLTSPVASGAVKPVTYKAGDKVTVTNPRTAAVTYIAGSASAGASSAGSVSWTPDAGVGGSWTLKRTPSSGSAETATFTVATPAGTTTDPIGVYSTSDLDSQKADGKYYKFLASSGSLVAPAGWTLYYNSSSNLYWLYQWPAVGTGSYTAASPKVINAASALTTAGYYTLYGDYKVSAPSGYSSYSVGSGKITSISTATNGSTLYRKGSSEDYWLYLWPTTGSGTAASPYIINSQSSLTSNGSYYAFYGDSLASVPSGYTKANSSGTAVTSVVAPAGWTLYRNSASTIFYLYQWRAAGYGSKTISSPLVVDNSTISSVAEDGLYYTPYGGTTAEIFGDTVSGYTTVYSMGSGSITSITVPSGYKSYVAGDGIFWLNEAAHTSGGSATSIVNNGTEATASGFHLHTATVTDGATTRTLSSVSELYPLTYQANTPINVTAPVNSTLMAAQSSAGVYNWTPDSLGTWTLSHVIDGTTYNATFKLGAEAASSGYYLITWKQDSSTVIDATYVASGATPTHADPEREADDTNVYAFNGWTPTVVAATADASYTAQWTTTPVVAKVGSARYTSFAAAFSAAGTTGSNTIVMRKNDTTATTLTVGQILKVDNTAATYSGTVSASGTNVKIVTSTSGNVTTYTCKYDLSKATIAVSGTYTYTGSAITPTYTVTLNGTTLTKNTHFTETLSNNTAAGSSATITITGKSGTNYDGTASKTFTIGTASLTDVSCAQSGSLTYTGSAQPPTLNKAATAKGGQTVTWKFCSTQNGTYSTSVPTYTTSGTLWYQVSAPNHATSSGSCAITVGNATIGGTLAQSNTLTYNGSAQQPTVSGLTSAGSQAITIMYGTASGTYNLSAIPTRKDAGSATYFYQATAANHTAKTGTVTVGVGQRTATLSWSNTSLTYTGSAQQPTCSVSNLCSGDICTVTVSGEQTNAGTGYTATATALSNSNYALPSDKTTTFAIGKAGLTVTAKAKSIVYGAAPANDGVTYSGFVGSDSAASLGGTLAYDYSYSQYGDIGSYTITPKGLTSSNYAITFAAGTLTVTAKPVTLTWSNTSLTYSGSSQKPTAAIPSGTLVNNDAVTVSVAGEKKDAGSNYTATATLSGAKAGNYSLSNATQAFSIGKAGLTVTADNKSVTYGDAAPAYTVTYSGWKTGDSASVLTAAATATSAYTATTKPGSYDITASGAEAANYTFSYVKGTLTVGKAPLTATGSSHTVKYGAAAPAYSVSYTGWRNGDGVGKLSAAPTATSTYTTTSPVGEYAVTVSGGASDWYDISYVSGKVTVEKADAAANVVANSGLIYSGEAQALVTASGVTGGTISYSVDSGAYGASATGVLPKSYTVAWKVTGDSNHADKTGSVSVSISGSVPGARDIKLNDGVTVAIPAGVTVTVDTDKTAVVPAGKTVTVAVVSSGVRVEVTGAAAVYAAGGIALSGGDAVYLYSNQNDIDSISRLTVPAINGSKLKIKAVE